MSLRAMFVATVVMGSLLNQAQAGPQIYDPNALPVTSFWYQGPGHLINLVRFKKDVQTHLKITDDEKASIEQLAKKYAQMGGGMSSSPKQRPTLHARMYDDLKKILGKTRVERLQQLDYQRTPTRENLYARLAFDIDLGEQLFSIHQRKKIDEVRNNYLAQVKDYNARRSSRKLQGDEIGKERQRILDEHHKAIKKVISDKDFARYQKMQGEKFEGDLRLSGGRSVSGGIIVG